MRALRALGTTILMGALLGYVGAALVGAVFQERGVVGTGESPEARQFMISLLASDPDSIAALTPERDVVSRAAQFQQTQEGRGQWVPISLTYLGGASQGRLSVHMYAVEMRTTSGQNRFFPLALTLVNGKVVRRE